MKRVLTILSLLACVFTASAQHMEFCGVSMEGKIADFAKALREKNFKLKEKRVDNGFYVMEGTYCAVSSTFTVSYTPRTKTVYQIRVMPRHIDEMAYVEKLTSLYGEAQETENGLRWEMENGGVFYVKPEGMDPYVIIVDAAGFALYKEEK